MSVVETIIHDSASFNGLLCLAKNKKPSHAYLLTGLSSATLISVAESFGKWLHCEGSDSTPCNTCKDCLLWQSGTHPALSVVRASGKDISIDAIRELIEKTAYRTSGHKHRIFIIDEVAAITEEGANAFLKTLEEPPEGTLFLLLTTRPSAVMGTISSRCLSVKISLPSPKQIIENFLTNTTWSRAHAYIALLLSETSLKLIDVMTTSTPDEISSITSPDTGDKKEFTLKLSELTNQLAGVQNQNSLHSFASSELFTSSPSYLLNLFNEVTKWVARFKTNENKFISSVATALSVDSANKTIEELVEQWFKDEEKIFKEIFGKKSKDLSLVAVARKRHKRRLVREHILLFAKCIEIATRLGIELQSLDREDPYDIEINFPQLSYFRNFTVAETESVRQIIKQCRQRLEANVTEKAIIVDLCLKLATSLPDNKNITFSPSI